MENKKMRTLRLKILLILAVVVFTASGCAENDRSMNLENVPIEHETEFGGCYIKITISDFLDLGYRFGDSVRVEFSNGYILESLPFYSGYYVGEEEMLLVGYPGYPYIKVAVYNGEDFWDDAGLTESDTASISLNEAGRYSAIQDARDVHQTTDRSEYDSDEIFANFRSVSGGRLKDNLIFRSSSPCDNTYGRAAYADALLEKNGIKLIVNMSDTEESLRQHIQDSSPSAYYMDLYENGRILLPVINTRYGTDEIKHKIAEVMRTVSKEEGPYLFHCSLGKDRTGFVCLLLEMLAGATYEEMLDDYMLTYDNFYHISPHNEPEKYKIVIDESFTELLHYLVRDERVDLQTADLAPYAETYLKEGGMSDMELEALKAAIMN
ncbi:MAG: tyrosine-protein phosphatase [Erysipelotrichaceae bacterium]|nr:tyrosine-protein phosphatase [Erysipelotrichaceae bacterium]